MALLRHPRVRLKNIKYAAFASQETACFTATVYVDGKRTASVRNEGHGGPNRYDCVHDATGLQALKEYAASLPPYVSGYDDMELPYCDEMIVAECLTDELDLKDLKRHCKKKTLFRLEGDPEGEFRQIMHPYCEKVKAHLESKYGKCFTVANEEITNL